MKDFFPEFSFFSCIFLKFSYNINYSQMDLSDLRKGGEKDGRSHYEECSKEREGLYVLCGWQGKPLPCKNGPWREKEKEIVVINIGEFVT